MQFSEVDKLWAITPIDGRYRNKTGNLAECVSEAALVHYRLQVEAAWLLHLSEVNALGIKLTPAVKTELTRIFNDKVSADVAATVKNIENKTNHDVKAVEYYLRDLLKAKGADAKVLAFIHFACTSEDINNIAYVMMLRDVRKNNLLPQWQYILEELSEKCHDYASLAMLSRTHGQAATPTTLGKELSVFGHRLLRYYNQLQNHPLEAKMNGAVGNYNAHQIAFPKVDWPTVSKNFIEKRLGLKMNTHTTQIENHDSLVEFIGIVRSFNNILLGMCRDIWGYISLGYFNQFTKKDEVGSSTMPHKVNPIDFENAEGNLGIANAMASHFCDKLMISRWQRDLSDSTVLRALGTYFGHCVVSYHSTLKGLARINAAKDVIAADLTENWGVLAEAIQTVMRRFGVMDAYERLKDGTRGQVVTRESLAKIVTDCAELNETSRNELLALTPSNYLGLSERLALDFCERVKELQNTNET